MRKHLSKILLISLLGVIAIPIFVLGAIGSGNIGSPTLWKKSGSAIFPFNSSWELGSSGSRVAKGWFSDLDAALFTIGGAIAGDITLTDGGQINTTNNGDITFLPNGSGNTRVGDAGVPSNADGQDDLFVSGKLEVDGNIYADANIFMDAGVYLSLNGSSYPLLTMADEGAQTDVLVIAGGTTDKSIELRPFGELNSNYGHGGLTDLTLIGHSNTAAASETDEWWGLSHNTTDAIYSTGSGNINFLPFSEIVTFLSQTSHLTDNGSAFNIKSISEVVVIPALSVTANSSSNLAPVGSTIHSVVVRVTDGTAAPATELDVGRTNGGNLDEYIDGISTALNTTGKSMVNNDTVLHLPQLNIAADTFTVTLNAAAPVADPFSVRIEVFYTDETAPTS